MNVIFKTPSGDEMVIIPRAEYETLLDAAEMNEDIAAFDRFHQRLAAGEEELIPAEFVNRLIEGEHAVRVWREYRGLTIKQLAETAGLAPAYISQIEAGKREGTIETLRKIAQALTVTLDDLAG